VRREELGESSYHRSVRSTVQRNFQRLPREKRKKGKEKKNKEKERDWGPQRLCQDDKFREKVARIQERRTNECSAGWDKSAALTLIVY